MNRQLFSTVHAALFGLALIATTSNGMYAQDSQNNAPSPAEAAQQQAPAASGSGGWRRVGDSPKATRNAAGENSSAVGVYDSGRDAQYDASQTPDRNFPAGEGAYSTGQAPAPNYQIPPRLTIKPGTFITVRINQTLSSDRNQQGDSFSATLARPL